MILKEWISNIFKKKNSDELTKVLNLLVECCKSKLILLKAMKSKNHNWTMTEFRQPFLNLLAQDNDLEIIEKNLVNDKKLKEDFTAWKNSVTSQKRILNTTPVDWNMFDSTINEEMRVLSIEIENSKKIEKQNVTEKGELGQNMQKIKSLKFPIDRYPKVATIMIENMDLVNLMLSKAPDEHLFMMYSMTEVVSFIHSREDLEFFVNVVTKIKPTNIPSLFRFIYDCISLIKSREDLVYIGFLFVNLDGKTEIENFDKFYLLNYELMEFLKKYLIRTKEDLNIILSLLIEQANKMRKEHVRTLFRYGFPSLFGAGLIKSIDNLKVVCLLLDDLNKKIQPEHLDDLIRYGLSGIVNLIKSEGDFKDVSSLIRELIKKLGPDKSRIVFLYGLRHFKSVEELRNADVPSLINISRALYSKQKDSNFYSQEKDISRREFEKTGSRTVLLGGKLVGKVVIKIVREEAFLDWKKALESVDVWKKEGFDYVPIEPILTKNGKLRFRKRKDGRYEIATKVLGETLTYFIGSSLTVKPSDFNTPIVDQKTKYELIAQANKIRDVLLNKLLINHGQLHDSNFCTEIHEGKIRLYAIDFDRSVVDALKYSA